MQESQMPNYSDCHYSRTFAVPKLPNGLWDGDYDNYDNYWLSNINLQIDIDNSDTYGDFLVKELQSC
jgi:hypothetical protein